MLRLCLSFCVLGAAVGLASCKKKPDPASDAANPPPAVAVNSASPMNSLKDQTLADLKSASADKRTKAINTIGAFGHADPELVIPSLIQMLADKSTSEGVILGDPNSARETAVLALLKLGPAGERALTEEALPILVSALKDSDAGVREHALLAISLLGPKAQSKTGELLNLCQDADGNVRRAAFRALSKVGNVTATDYVLLLKNSDPKIAYDAASALNELGESQRLPKEIVPILADALEKPPEEKEPAEAALTRIEIAEVLARFGPDAEPAVAGLMNALKATTLRDFILRSRTSKAGRMRELPLMTALRKIGKPAVAPLIEALDEKNPIQCYMAARILGGIGPDAAAAIPKMQKMFDETVERLEPNFMVVCGCGPALYQMGVDPEALIAKIVALLKIADAQTREFTAYALALFGRKGGKAAVAMVQLLDDENDDVREQAVIALTAFGPAAQVAVPTLAARLDDRQMRASTIVMLTKLGPLAAEAVPALIKQLGAPDEAYRRDVLAAIKAIGPGAKEAVPDVARLIRAADEREQILAIETLGRIGPDAKSAIPDLVKLFADKKTPEPARAEVLSSLGMISTANSEVLKAMTDGLKGNFMIVRLAAVRALARLGPAARSAADALKAFGGERSPASETAVWSAAALYKIGVNTSDNLRFVVAALRDKAPDRKQARLAAINASDLLGAAAKEILPELIGSLNDKQALSKYNKTPVQLRAVEAIGKMGPAAKDAVPKLVNLLKQSDANEPMKSAALEALGQIGPSAAFAAARLREIIRTDPFFAAQAQAALDLIEAS